MEQFYAALPAIISGITVMLVAFIAKWIRQMMREMKHDRAVNEQALMWQLRNVIWSPYYSFEEKTVAYKEYRERGGNSLTEAHYQRLQTEQINHVENGE